MSFRPFIALLASAVSLPALTIKIDYTYDTNGFFDTQEKKDAMEAVAKFYGDLIQDNLLEIDASTFIAPGDRNPKSGNSFTASFNNPQTGGGVQIPGLVIPEDTIIVFVGARPLSGNQVGLGGPGGFGLGAANSAWIDRVLGRGQEGAESRNASQRTDIGALGRTSDLQF